VDKDKALRVATDSGKSLKGAPKGRGSVLIGKRERRREIESVDFVAGGRLQSQGHLSMVVTRPNRAEGEAAQRGEEKVVGRGKGLENLGNVADKRNIVNRSPEMGADLLAYTNHRRGGRKKRRTIAPPKKKQGANR